MKPGKRSLSGLKILLLHTRRVNQELAPESSMEVRMNFKIILINVCRYSFHIYNLKHYVTYSCPSGKQIYFIFELQNKFKHLTFKLIVFFSLNVLLILNLKNLLLANTINCFIYKLQFTIK